jgi:hypothetical protein
MVVVSFLHILVWHAIKGDVKLFKLVPWVAMMVPHLSKPHASF